MVFCTSGPGATNILTGLATAYMDSIPLIVITVNVPSNIKGYDNFQEIDIVDMCNSITKHNFRISRIEELQQTIIKAFKIAQTGRFGPVLIDISKDVTMEDYKYIENLDIEITNKQKNNFSYEDIDKIAKCLNENNKIHVIVGGGVIKSNSTKEVELLVNKLNATVSSTLMGIGGYTSGNENNLGLIGMHGSVASNTATMEADVILGLGTRFSDRSISNSKTFGRNNIVIHIDVDPSEINKIIRADYQAVGDIKKILELINLKLIQKQDKSWIEEMINYKKEFPLKIEETHKLNPQFIIQKAQELCEKETIIVTDVGQHQMWAAQFSNVKYPRQFITSGGLGTMGFGLGASIGSKIGNMDKQVLLFTGDGSFQMNMNELATCRMYDIPITIFVMNNGVLGMVRQWQKVLLNNRYSQTTIKQRNIDYSKLAETFQFSCYNLYENSQIEEVINKAYKNNGTTMINCMIDEDINVLPMVLSGKPLEDAILEIKD